MNVQAALDSRVFTKKTLTKIINNIQLPRLRIAELGWFEEKGIRTTSIEIAYRNGQVMLIPEKKRGESGTRIGERDVVTHTFKAVHLPAEAEVFADDVQNMKSWENEDDEDELKSLESLVADKTEDGIASLEATVEFLRFGAVYGKIYGANGNLIVDLFEKFNIKLADAQDTIDFSKVLRTQLQAAKRNSEKHQTGVKAKKFRALASPEFMDLLQENDDFVKAMDRYNNGSALRDDVRSGIYWQEIFWEENTEEVTKPNGQKERFVKAGEALLVPEGKRGLFLTRFAPADYEETVNTVGLPYYASAERKKHNKGVDLELQSNPINVCTNPLAIRRLKIKT
ncbi:major capsid protein [Pontibacterium sp.]|uniref:major capsid protein n=1 Tax=Pontibacterium sp. TaxID=2036026 RepID=UPI003561A32A